MPAIGIDLGTTNSCVGCCKNGKIEIIPNANGKRTIPSIIAYRDTQIIVGEAAQAQINSNSANTIYDAKRIIGTIYGDPTIQSDIQNFPFEVCPESQFTGETVCDVAQRSSKAVFKLARKMPVINNRDWVAPEEVSSELLKHLKNLSQGYLGSLVTHAVITVPAYFNNQQREATKRAAEMAGLTVLRMINEPTAAAIAYGHQNKISPLAEDTPTEPPNKTILVFDLGGGTFDVSLLQVDSDQNYHVRAVDGNSHLGGEDFTLRMVQHLLAEFCESNGLSLQQMKNNKKVIRRLRERCEEAKKLLSTSETVLIEIENLYQDLDFFTSMSKATFDHLCADLFRQTLEPISTVLNIAQLDKSAIDEIIFIGGSTRIPRIRDMIQHFFAGKSPSQTVNPDEAVAYGAAMLASKLYEEQGSFQQLFNQLESTPSSPTSSQRSPSPQESVTANPPIASNAATAITLHEVIPMTISIEYVGGITGVIAKRNTPIPFTVESDIATSRDFQRTITTQVLEGESRLVERNNVLGVFSIGKLPNKLRNQVIVKVKYHMDLNGILTVTATESSDPSNTTKITISNVTNKLTPLQRLRMIRDIEENTASEIEEYDRRVARKNFRVELSDVQRLIDEPPFNNNSRQKSQIRDMKKLLKRLEKWFDDYPDASVSAFDSQRKYLETKFKLLKEACGQGTTPPPDYTHHTHSSSVASNSSTSSASTSGITNGTNRSARNSVLSTPVQRSSQGPLSEILPSYSEATSTIH